MREFVTLWEMLTLEEWQDRFDEDIESSFEHFLLISMESRS